MDRSVDWFDSSLFAHINNYFKRDVAQLLTTIRQSVALRQSISASRSTVMTSNEGNMITVHVSFSFLYLYSIKIRQI